VTGGNDEIDLQSVNLGPIDADNPVTIDSLLKSSTEDGAFEAGSEKDLDPSVAEYSLKHIVQPGHRRGRSNNDKYRSARAHRSPPSRLSFPDK
jgi:hypothetical protein